jgi:hypothetical protein
MSTTTETTTTPMRGALLAVIDSALLRQDIEALLEELRRADDEAYEVVGGTVNMEARRWARITERADLLTQSYVLAKARGQGGGGGRG